MMEQIMFAAFAIFALAGTYSIIFKQCPKYEQQRINESKKCRLLNMEIDKAKMKKRWKR